MDAGAGQTGRYSNSSDYVRDLIRRNQKRADKIAAARCPIDEAEESGVGTVAIDEI